MGLIYLGIHVISFSFDVIIFTDYSGQEPIKGSSDNNKMCMSRTYVPAVLGTCRYQFRAHHKRDVYLLLLFKVQECIIHVVTHSGLNDGLCWYHVTPHVSRLT